MDCVRAQIRERASGGRVGGGAACARLHEGVQLRRAGAREEGDGDGRAAGGRQPAPGRRAVPLRARAALRVHGELHRASALAARQADDEQRA